jgi:hypothetical protein
LIEEHAQLDGKIIAGAYERQFAAEFTQAFGR